MYVTASDVKKLREQTGAGMMACKNALVECDGVFEDSIDYLRKKGLAAAQKKQSRIASEGIIYAVVEKNVGVLVEVNCETDFVSKGEDFNQFALNVANYILKENPSDIEDLKSKKQDDVNELTLKIGEKISIRRYRKVNGETAIGHYCHSGRIGVLVNIKSDMNQQNSPEFQVLLKDLAMHVAAANPKFLKSDDIDTEFKKREARVYTEQLKEEGKPENMIEKIVQGKLRKLVTEVCFMEQKFVKDSKITILKLIKDFGHNTKILGFEKLNLGEGIEKKEDNLAEEVAKMTNQE